MRSDIPSGPEATRHSLLERLGNWEDQARWQEFFDTYWRLIYAVARRAGLQDAEAHDVVQETILAVARNITRYERTAGRFKPWLLQMTRWRIADQFRRRLPAAEHSLQEPGTARETATLERIPGPAHDLADVWESEWQQRLLEAALERVKRKVKPLQFQIFDCALRKHWPASKIAKSLGVNVAQVYLTKHRLAALLRREVLQAEAGTSAR